MKEKGLKLHGDLSLEGKEYAGKRSSRAAVFGSSDEEGKDEDESSDEEMADGEFGDDSDGYSLLSQICKSSVVGDPAKNQCCCYGASPGSLCVSCCAWENEAGLESDGVGDG